MLLARCYEELGEPEMQQNAYLQALGAQSARSERQAGLGRDLVSQGDTLGRSRNIVQLVKQVPGFVLCWLGF